MMKQWGKAQFFLYWATKNVNLLHCLIFPLVANYSTYPPPLQPILLLSSTSINKALNDNLFYIFYNFDNFNNFWQCFAIFDNFDNLWQFWQSLTILTIFDNFDNFVYEYFPSGLPTTTSGQFWVFSECSLSFGCALSVLWTCSERSLIVFWVFSKCALSVL